MTDKLFFDGDNNFLNIDYEFRKPITYNGNEYTNLKHAMDKAEQDKSDTWENCRLDILKTLNLKKFKSNNELKQKLIDTGDENLYIDSDHNYLGKILISCRKAFQNDKSINSLGGGLDDIEEPVNILNGDIDKSMSIVGGGLSQVDTSYLNDLRENMSKIDFTQLTNNYWDNIKEIERIYNARNTLLDVLATRGFLVDNLYMANDVYFHSIIDSFMLETDYLLLNELDIFVESNQSMDIISMNNEKVFIKFIYNEDRKKINYPKLIKNISCIYDIKETDSIFFVIVSSNIDFNVFMKYDRDNIFIFDYMKIQVNILEHKFVPKHIIIPKEEARDVCRAYRIKKSQLPVISRNDPVAKLIGAKEGQVVKILRNSPTNVVSYFYRIVVFSEYPEPKNIEPREKVTKENKENKDKKSDKEPVEVDNQPTMTSKLPITRKAPPPTKKSFQIVFTSQSSEKGLSSNDINKLYSGGKLGEYNKELYNLHDNIPKKWQSKDPDKYNANILVIKNGYNDIVGTTKDAFNLCKINSEQNSNGVIDDFHKEDTLFLSNFYKVDIEYDGDVYPTVEHAFQAAKTNNPDERAMIQGLKKPEQAKKNGKKVALRSDWDSVKVDIMRELVGYKFMNNSELSQKLSNTIGKELIEGNKWGDTFWGISKGKGENWLGKILMEIRDTIVVPRRIDFDKEAFSEIREKVTSSLHLDHRLDTINLDYYNDSENSGHIYKGESKETNNKVLVHLGEKMPITFQWYRYSQSGGKFVTGGNPINIILDDGDIVLFSEKATGKDHARHSVISVRHSLGNKYLKSDE